MIRIVIIDDHELVRTGFRLILEQQPDIQVVGEAADGEQGLALVRSLKPDVAMVDVHMPGLSGIEVTERLRKLGEPTRIMIVTMVSESPVPRRLLEAGASGYITKSCPGADLLRAVRTIADGRRYLAPSIAEALALDSITGSAGSPFDTLSARELEVAMMLARGQSMLEIAEKLCLSNKTVATYKYRLFEKLNIDNLVTLAHLASLHGLMEQSTAR